MQVKHVSCIENEARSSYPCANVFQTLADTFKFKLLIEHKDTEGAQLGRQASIQAEAKPQTCTQRRCRGFGRAAPRARLVGEGEPPSAETGQAGPGEEQLRGQGPLKAFGFFQLYLLLKCLDSAVIYMTNMYKFRQLHPEYKKGF